MARDGLSADTLFAQVSAYIKGQQVGGAKGYVSLIHFLDRNVSGCVLFAKSSKAAARLHKAFKERTIQKTYVAVVSGCVTWQLPQKLVDHLAKDHDRNLVSVSPEGKLCELSVVAARDLGGKTLLEIEPKTGRSHQIRVQLASRGFPILGDKKYGSREGFPAGIALHAEALELIHPTEKTTLRISAPRPEAWRQAAIPGSRFSESRQNEKT
jgi:23S rRNA pseudouridine1911/1915/1917 synthase